MERYAYLKNVPLFEELEKRDLSRVMKIGKIQRYGIGDAIFTEHTPGDRLYVVMEGRVKIYATSGAKKKTLAYLEKGEFFGEMALLDMEPRSASSVAQQDCELLVITKKDFRALLTRYPRISFQMMKTLSSRLRQADREIESLAFGNVLDRVAATIIELAEKYGEETPRGTRIKMPFSHKDIAEIAGTGREVVSRILTRFKRLQCIDYEDRCLIITDSKKLKGWVY